MSEPEARGPEDYERLLFYFDKSRNTV
jgi:hypothetical protein